MSPDAKRRRALLLAIGAGLAAAPAAAAGGTPAAGGVRLLEAMESGSVVVVGRVAELERLDRHSFRAEISIETRVGAAPERVDASPIRVAWEELAQGRPPRFQNGDRVLLCLEALGSASIWSQRIPDATLRGRTAGIAMEGRAFLRDPGLGTVDVLHHYLSLPPEARETETGVGHLVTLAESSRPPVATSAVRRLGRIEALNEKLTPTTAAGLVRALARDDLGASGDLFRPALKSAAGPILTRALRDALAGGSASPQVFEALAGVAELSSGQISLLREHPEPRYRAALARTSADPELLRALLRNDSAPSVRSAALERLLALDGATALDDALTALADADAGVRAAAARGAGRLGGGAVAGLESVAYGRFAPSAGSIEAPRSAIAGLSFAGPRGRSALARIAKEHPDESLRKLAGIALGEFRAHVH